MRKSGDRTIALNPVHVFAIDRGLARPLQKRPYDHDQAPHELQKKAPGAEYAEEREEVSLAAKRLRAIVLNQHRGRPR